MSNLTICLGVVGGGVYQYPAGVNMRYTKEHKSRYFSTSIAIAVIAVTPVGIAGS
jgi:hypothetical protein